ncbi:MAG TPA: glycerol-3-phosphate 1-O-acyltransferase PlsY [Candidatus Omnitrophota bacterium]|jgi:glycerol-3-phosphate acyltransferase PlsY|nr:glycerol-3-phosphate 1-O-acyltransferase PlsY [Candidatus Omnitrophota bacterium]HSA31915.1 glycerol-3-phosphate 1-O-acyltransferase PlsY [Candidatus Omnitrophota bacterium]
MVAFLLGAALSYFIGSIPTAYVYGKWTRGIDIRGHGSGNIGATNTFRVLGKGPGIFVLICDILKGIVAVVGVAMILNISGAFARAGLGLAAVAGHNWTIFLNFKGGKGIATSLGVLIGLAISFPALWPALGLTLFLWGVVFFMSGYVSLASMVAAVGLPVFVLAFHLSSELMVLSAILCILVIIRHKSNITRLLCGTENRVRFGKK